MKAVFRTEMVILLKYVIIIIIYNAVKFVYSRQQKMKIFLTSKTIMANYEWKS